MKQKGSSLLVLIIFLTVLGVVITKNKYLATPKVNFSATKTSSNSFFSDIDSEVDLNSKKDPWIIRQKAADIQRELFLEDKNTKRITLNLFPDVVYEVEAVDITGDPDSSITWIGNVVKFNSQEIDCEDCGDGTVIIVVSQEGMALSVSAIPGVNSYNYGSQSIKGAPYFLTDQNYYLIQEIDNSLLPLD